MKKHKSKRQKTEQPSPSSHGNPKDHGKVPPEEAIRIESYDLPSGDPGLTPPKPNQ